MKKKMNISILVAAVISLCFFLAGAVLIFVSYRTFEKQYVSLCNDNLNSYVKMASSYVNVEAVEAFEQTGDMNEEAQRTYDDLLTIRVAVPDVNYLFVYRPCDVGFTYIMDVHSEEDDADNYSTLGDVYEFDEWAEEKVRPDILAEKPSEQIIEQPDMGFGRVLCAWAPVFDASGKMVYMVEADMMIDSVKSYVNHYILQIALIFAVCLLLDLLFTIWASKKLVTNPLVALTKYVESYEDGNFSGETFQNATSDEVQRLSDSFTQLNLKIDNYVDNLMRITADRERIGAELDLATKIQHDYLPTLFPPFPDRDEFNIYATMDPAKEVGGDFYDFFLVDKDHLALVIADVSGKGVGAALYMMISMTLIQSQANHTESPAAILKEVNNLLCEKNEASMFVTAWVGILEISTGLLKAASAGHEYPMIYRDGGQYELMKDRHGLPLGAMEGVSYKEYEIQLNKNDAIYVYTDGVAEATNAEGVLFGTDRTLESLNQDPTSNMEDTLYRVKESIDDFVQEAEQFDDITMLGVRYFG